MKNKLFLFLILLTVGLQAWFLYIVVRYPYMGIDVKQKDGRWVIEKISDATVHDGLEFVPGEEIIAVNGINTGQYKSVLRWRDVEQVDELLVSRDGKEILITVPHRLMLENYDVLSLIGEVSNLLIVYLLYAKMRRSRSAQYLAIVFLNLGFVFMCMSAAHRSDGLGEGLILTFSTLLPVVFLHFLYVFFKERGGLTFPERRLKYYFYTPAILIFLLSLSFLKPVPVITYRIYQVVAVANAALMVVGIVLNAVFLIAMFKKYRKHNNHLAVLTKTIFVVLVISFLPFCVLSGIPFLLFGHLLVQSSYTGWSMLLFPLSFVYLIGARKLYDVDVVLRRAVFTVLLSLVPSGIFIAFIALTVPAISSQILAVFYILLVGLFSVVLYSLEYFITKFEPVMFPRKHKLQLALKKIAAELRAITSFREITEVILADVITVLNVYGGAIVIHYKDSIEIFTEGDIDAAAVERFMQGDGAEADDFTLFMINHHEEYTSYLVMSRKRTNTLLSQDERNWLNLIISYLGVSLENVYLIRKLTSKLELLAAQLPNEEASADFIWFRKLMFELQEKERKRIAMDLHDSTIQDMIFLKRRLMAFSRKHDLPDHVLAEIDSVIEYVEIISTNLRQSCFELFPHLLQEAGLVGAIRKLIDLEIGIASFEIHFVTGDEGAIERRDLETKRQLFRVVQELLNNAKKHSQATAVSMELMATEGNVVLRYEDNGIGFDPQQSVDHEVGGSGMGMMQMKSRILSLGGKFELSAARGRGVRFTAFLPGYAMGVAQ